VGAALIATATSAFAEEPPFTVKTPLFTSQPPSRPLFEAAPFAAAQVPPSATPSKANEHQFGGGIRLGGVSFGVGGTIRYFFYNGALGVQADVTHYRFSIREVDWSAIGFAPSAIYRFADVKFQGPYHLTPYAGLGMSFIHTYSEENPDLLEAISPDDTSLGALIYGGAELSFDKIPNFTVSGELVFLSNHERLNADINDAPVPWPGFVIAAHWYFW
jgi:hypothetical protein